MEKLNFSVKWTNNVGDTFKRRVYLDRYGVKVFKLAGSWIPLSYVFDRFVENLNFWIIYD